MKTVGNMEQCTKQTFKEKCGKKKTFAEKEEENKVIKN